MSKFDQQKQTELRRKQWEQKKKSWIDNVVRIQGYTEEQAEIIWNRVYHDKTESK